MSSRHRRLLELALPLVTLAVLGAVAFVLLSAGEPPVSKPPVDDGVLVEAVRVERRPYRLDVPAQGTVVAARRVTLTPQVGGRLVWVSERLAPGSLVRKGELLARIDDRDFRLALQEARTALTQARAELSLEHGRRRVAQREWELFKDEAGGGELDPSLALRGPQLKSARVAVEAARTGVRRAGLDLERTRIEAPFNAFIESKSAAVGQLVGPQTPIANLIGTDILWVEVALPVDRVAFIDVPGPGGRRGSRVLIHQDLGAERVERTGRVEQLFGDVEQTGRMARVLVAIEDPFALRQWARRPSRAPRVPLLVGSYVEVEIRGSRVEELVEVPRQAVRGRDQVYLVDGQGRLAIHDVEVVWRLAETVLIGSGLKTGDLVITSRLAAPVEGMKLRLEERNGVEVSRRTPNEAQPRSPGGLPR